MEKNTSMKVKNLKFKYGDGREYGEEDGDATLIFFPIFQEDTKGSVARERE